MPRFAAIDVGTNSVLLLVAERGADGRFSAVEERAEITRLGRGVDATRTLSAEGIEDTLQAIEKFVAEARKLGAQGIAISATSAARDASNGAVFLSGAKARTGVQIEIISGDEEARLSFASAFSDFGGTEPLVVIDIGGGSTEFIFGDQQGAISFRHSFDVGAVRLSERFVKTDPPADAELGAIRALLRERFKALPAPARGTKVIGIAGTVTTIFGVARRVEPYDPRLVHGATLSTAEVKETVERLSALPVHLRRGVPGLQPKRADVIVSGGLVLETALETLGATELVVSDRGLRWGLLGDRFGATA